MPDQIAIDAAADRRRAEAFLHRDALRHIVPLKMLRTFGSALPCHVEQDNRHTGVLLLLPTVVSAWDGAHYTNTDLVALLVAGHPGIADTLLAHVPIDGRLVLKVAGAAETAALR